MRVTTAWLLVCTVYLAEVIAARDPIKFKEGQPAGTVITRIPGATGIITDESYRGLFEIAENGELTTLVVLDRENSDYCKKITTIRDVCRLVLNIKIGNAGIDTVTLIIDNVDDTPPEFYHNG